jgi:type II secretory pathway pseudopilin PulG
LLLEVIAGLAILVGIAAAILTAFQFQLELENREEDRVNRAWSLVAAAKEVQGNIGLIEALETLNASSSHFGWQSDQGGR